MIDSELISLHLKQKAVLCRFQIKVSRIWKIEHQIFESQVVQKCLIFLAMIGQISTKSDDEQLEKSSTVKKRRLGSANGLKIW